jgi:hypothetical protein
LKKQERSKLKRLSKNKVQVTFEGATDEKGPMGPPPVPLTPEVIPLATLKYWEDWYKAKIVKEEEGGAGGGGGDGVLKGAEGVSNANDNDEDDDDEVFEWLTGTGADGGALWRRLMSLPRDARVLELGCGGAVHVDSP